MKVFTRIERSNRQVALYNKDAPALSFYNNAFVKIFLPASEGYIPSKDTTSKVSEGFRDSTIS